jgi:hypothetical protein
LTQIYPIRLVRLVTGETLVTGIGESGKNNYVLERPMLLVTMAVEGEGNDESPQQVSVAMKDWIDFTGDDYIIVRKDIVVCIVKPVRGIVSDYMQAKMTSDIMDDMMERDNRPMTVDDLVNEDDGGGVADPQQSGKDEQQQPDEFPGWGGNPDLS